MNRTLALYQRLTSSHDRLGRTAFSVLFWGKAPYFRTARPVVQVMEPHRGVVRIRKRWGVQNHIGTVHAIAVANGMEMAMGLLAEATVPDGLRWLPQGIHLDYLAKTPGDVECVATTTAADWDREPPFTVNVAVTGTLVSDGTVAVQGTIPIYVSARPDNSAG